MTRKEKALVKEFGKKIHGKRLARIVKAICGEHLNSGLYRDVYVYKYNPDYVVKVQRNPSQGDFSNVMEFRYFTDNEAWKDFSKWLAPCITITETGEVLLQRRIYPGRRKDYPKYIPSMLTDLKVTNFGWLSDGSFVACDYAFILLGDIRLKYAKWWGKNIK